MSDRGTNVSVFWKSPSRFSTVGGRKTESAVVDVRMKTKSGFHLTGFTRET